MSDPHTDPNNPFARGAPAPAPPAANSQQNPFGHRPAAPQPGALQDSLDTIFPGLVRGITGLLGTVGNTREGMSAAAEWVARKFGASPEDAHALVHTVISQSMIGGGGDPLFHASGQGQGAPTSGQLNSGLEHVTGQHLYQPRTTAGRYVNAVAEFAPNLFTGPEGWGAKAVASKVAGTVVPAVASQGAADVATASGHPEWAPAASMGGALLGGVVSGLPFRPSGATRAISTATADMSDADIAGTQALRQTGVNNGVPLLLSEAGQYQTGNGTRLGQLQQEVQATRAGGDIIRPFLANRTQSAEQALADALDSIAPASTNPSMLGVRAQTGAQGALDGVRGQINQLADPFYQTLRNESLDPSFAASLQRNPSYQQALRTIRGSPELNGPLSTLPDDNLAVVNETVKQLDRDIAAARQTVQNPSGNNRLAGLRQAARDEADRLAGLSSPNWTAARSVVSAGRETYLDPLEAGPLGTMAGSDSTKAALGSLYPNRPLEGTADETKAAIDALGNQQLAAELARAHLGSSAAESFQLGRSGPNPYAPAAWAAQIGGNALQRENLMTGLEASAGPQAAGRVGDLLDVLGATGRRLPVGSQDDQWLADALQASHTNPTEFGIGLGVAKEALGGAMGPAAMLGLKGAAIAKNFASNWQAGKNAETLANLLISTPEKGTAGIYDARKAMSAADAQKAQMLANILTAGGQNQGAAP